MVSVSLLHYLASDHTVAFGENSEDVVRTPTSTKYIKLAFLSSILYSSRVHLHAIFIIYFSVLRVGSLPLNEEGYAESMGRWFASEHWRKLYPRTTVLNANLVIIVFLKLTFSLQAHR